MNTSFTARHFNASERLQEHALNAVKKLERFYDGIQDCDIVLSPHESHDNPQGAELTVKVTGTTLVATETAATYEQAIGHAVENMTRQLLKYKEKRFAKG
jgi:putative sigma-54 modulation protein